MLHWLIVLGPLVLLPIAALLVFVGCDAVFGLQHVNAVPTGYSDEIKSHPNLVSYWRLGEADLASPAKDDTGANPGAYSPTGVVLGVPRLTHVDDPAGPGLGPDTAAHFTTGLVSVPRNDDSLNPAHFTVEALVSLDPQGDGKFRAVVSSRDQQGSQLMGYILYASNTNNWEAWVGDGVNWNKAVGPAVQHRVQYVAMTYDGSTLTLYVDPLDSTQAVPIACGYLPNATRELRIGAGANETTPAFFFSGVIDEVAVYDEALDLITIEEHFAIAYTGMKPAP